MASANCSIDANGVPTGCAEASSSNSGMFVGANKDNLGNVIGIGSGTGELGNFQWNSQSNILTPRDSSGTEYNNLNFSFDSNEDNITGAENGDTYKISIGSQTNKTFLFNAGTNTLKSNLSIDFSSDEQIYLNAGGLEGNLTLKSFNGNSTVNLTDGITGKITNIGSIATLNFTSPSKPITLNEIETAGGSTTINFSNATAIINGAMIVGSSGNYDITLDSTAGATNLTINGAINIIRTFTALGDTNTLTLNSNITATNKNTIKTLVLGDPTGKKAGLLTISNNAKKDNNPVAITIDTLTSKHADSTLTISAGEVKITKAITTANANITLDSETTDSKTKLTLGNTTGNNTITNLTALSASNTAMNTLTIADTAKGANKIENLKLGDSTSGKAGLLTIANNGGALGIGTLTANGKGSKLALNGAYDAIGTLTLANGANLDLDASSVTDNNAKPLVVNTFAGSAGSELTISSGKLNITSQITTGNKVSNTFNIESGATLTLTGGFSTNGGGENKFFVKDKGTLTIEGITGADNKLTTTGVGSVTHFDIAANAKVTNFYNEFEATNGGINRLFYAQDLSLASITATGDKAYNEIHLIGKVTDQVRPTDHTLTLKGDITATNTGKAEGSGNEVDAKVISMASNSIIADNGVNQILADESITLKNLTASNNGLNTLNLNGNPNGTITLKKMDAQSGGNNEIYQDSGTLTLEGENTGGNAIAMSASGAGSKNYIYFKGSTLNITGNITTDQGGVNELNVNALSLTGDISATGSADSKNIISLGAGSSSVSGNITEASGGQNLFTLDSTSGATSLTLKGATNQITTFTATGDVNTLTLESTATNNSISTLTLGAEATAGANATPATNDTLNLNTANALTIGDLKLANTSGTLNITQGSKEKVTITTATLGGKTLTIDNANTTQALVINTLTTTSGTNTLNLNKGGAEITGKITAISSVTNNFNIASGATLTLTNGFETNGGTNAFDISGTLNLGTQPSKDLTTSNGGTTSFTIHKGATFDLTGKAITANTGGTNIITSDANITLGNIEATGNSSSNTIKINSGELKLGQITSTDSGKNSFTIGDGETAATLTLNTSTGVTTTNGGTTSFTIKKGSTLTLTGGQGSTLTANGANNEFIIENGATVNAGSSAGFYDTITATNSGKNIIKTSASFNLNALTANGGTNEITLSGTGNTTTMEITGAISGVGNNFTLDSSAKAGDKTNLTLKSKDGNTINTLTALGGTATDTNILTIDQQATGKHTITNLVLGDSENGGKAGLLTIDNKTTGNALTITNFEGKHTESKLTISAGEVAITNALAGENNNITLGANTALTLNGGKLKSLETKTTGTNTITFVKDTTIESGITAGNGVTNTINLNNGVTLTSAITANGGANNITLANNSNITGNITATSGTNTITLTGTNSTTSATINGEISGTGNNFTLDSKANAGDKTNLTLSGGDDKTIASLTALSNDADSMNTLTIDKGATGTNTISKLNLGEQSGTKTGFLTINNSSGNALTITNFASQDAKNILTIAKGAVNIENLANTGANNNIALGANTALTLNGKNNNFALEVSGTSSLKFGDNAVSNTISTLILGTTTNGTLNLSSANALTISNLNVANKIGTLDIASNSKGVSIGTATLKGGKTLKLNDNRKDTATLAINTLKTQGIGNQIYFHKDLKINTLSETTGTIKDDNKDNTSLTFVNQLTKNTDTQDPNKVTYTAGLLTINGSNNAEGNNQTKNPQLSGTYKMIIRGNETIKPEEIKENIKVATIKKYDGATSGGTQEQLRSQGVINLGKETGTTLAEDLTLLTFNYYVTETDETGNTQTNNQKDYITYFLNGHGETKLDIKQNILSNLALSATELYLANFNSLNRRMGELRDNKHAQGVWGRVFNGMQSNDANLKSSTLYTTVQAGYDYGFGLGEGVTNYLGFALSYGHSESGFKNKAIFENNFASIDSLKSDLVEFALYNSYVQDSGWYNDTVAKFSYLLNQVRYSSQSFMETSSHQGDINTYAFTLSNEFGYRFKLGASDEWYIDPQAEIGFGYFEGQDFKFKGDNSSLTKLGTMDSLLTLRSRFGASFGYDFKNFTSKESGLSAKLYLGVFGEVDYFNGGDVKFGSESAQWAINTDTRAVLNVGTNLEIKESTRLYLDVESSFGGKITTDYKINAGVRYAFGEKIQFLDVKHQENKEEAPLKLQEEEKKNTQEQTEKDVKEEAKAGGKEEAKMQGQAPRGEQVEAKKADTKKADVKAGKKPVRKGATKKQPVKKPA